MKYSEVKAIYREAEFWFYNGFDERDLAHLLVEKRELEEELKRAAVHDIGVMPPNETYTFQARIDYKEAKP